MKSARALIVICLIFVLVFSFAVIIQKQKTTTAAQQFNLLTFSANSYYLTTLSYHATLSERTTLLDNITRTNIYSFIQANPGVQFRAICSSLGLSIGVVQFHLSVLEKNGFISSLFKGKYKRFFVAGKFSRKEMETIAILKLETVRNIIKAILDGKRVAHHELATKLSITSQGLTWQMNRLQQTGLIEENRNGLKVTYSINTTYMVLITIAMAATEKQ